MEVNSRTRRDRQPTHVFKNVSKLSATLSPTASFTSGTSPLACVRGLLRFRLGAPVPGSPSSSSSSRVRAPMVGLRGVPPRTESTGYGALLGGRDDGIASGDEGPSESMFAEDFSLVVMRTWTRTRQEVENDEACVTSRV
jgi:hypothetical protein